MPHVSTAPGFEQTLQRPERADRVYILADDLTGACDAAAAFLRTSDQVRVWLDAGKASCALEGVNAFSTASRGLSPGDAADAVYCAGSALSDIPSALIFKKVDSALRGQVAAELIAAQRALRMRAILLASAFPEMGRTVCSGLLKIEDAIGIYDPIAIRDLFPATMQDAIAVIEHAGELAAAYQAGKTILVCDTRLQEDLEVLVCTARVLPSLLYAGSAGLAHAIAGQYPSVATTAQLPPRGRTLVICGTTHPVTKLQLKARDRNRSGTVEILEIEWEGREVSQIQAAFESFQPDALVLTGGDTALLALRTLQVESLNLQGELAPGTPWGFAHGGLADGKAIVTKSGGFGTSSTLNDILRVLAGVV